MKAVAVIPDLAVRLRQLADQVEDLDPAQVVGERAAHHHGPGILRDTVRCPACAATVPPAGCTAPCGTPRHP